MVCDKEMCERWCATKLCVCERWCGERWWVTKWCVKDGVRQSGVKDGASKMVCDKVVCERWCVNHGV